MNNLCACGCGNQAKPNNQYLNGHNARGDKNHNWKNGRRTHSQGYIFILSPGHPYKNHQGYVFEHILVMEKELGRYIRHPETVHHIDGNIKNNYIGNLMLFANNSMHISYEARLRSFNNCGHYDWLKCWVCKEYDDPNNLYTEPNKRASHHSKCINLYQQNKRNK